MRKNLLACFYTLLFTCLLVFGAFAQVNWDGGAGTNNWGDANNWNPNRVPLATDNVLISGATVTVDLNISNVSVLDLTVENGARLNINNTAGFDDFIVQGGASVTINQNINVDDFTVTGTNTVLNVNAQVNMSSSGGADLFILNNARVNFSAIGAIAGGGSGGSNGININIANGTTLATQNTEGFGAFVRNTITTGSIQVNPGRNVAGGTFVRLNTGINFIFNGNSSQTMGEGVAGANNLTILNPAGVKASRVITVSNLTIGQNTPAPIAGQLDDNGFQITSTGVLNLNNGRLILGNPAITLDGTSFPNFGTRNIQPGTFVEYAAGGPQTVALLTGTGIARYHHLVLSGTGVKTSSSGTLVVNGDFQINSTYNGTVNNPVISVGGNLLGNGNLAQGNSLLNLSGNWRFKGVFNPSNADVVLLGSGMEIDGAEGLTFNTLRLSSGTVSYTNRNPGALIVRNNLNGNGNFIQDAGRSLVLNGSSDITTLTATASGNTVTYGGGTQNVKTTSYHNLTLSTTSGNVTKTMNGVQTIAGNFTLSAPDGSTVSTAATTGMTIGGNVSIGVNTTFTSGNYTHNVAGNWNRQGTFEQGSDVARINFNGAGPQTISATTFNHLSFQNPGLKTATGGLRVNGDVTINTGSTFNAGDFLHPVFGNWTNNGTFEAAGSTVAFSAISGTQNIGRSNFNNVDFYNAGTKMATGNLSIAGNVFLNSNFNAGSGNFTHSVGGNWTNDGGTASAFTPGNSTIIFNGNNNQIIGSNNNRTTSFNNFVVNKTGGRLILAAPVTINRQAGFVSGIIDGTSAAVPLLFLDNAIIDPMATPSNLSHVNGPVRKSVNNSTAASRNFIFPIGKNGRYVPIELANVNGFSTLEAEYLTVPAQTLGPIGNSSVKRISNCEYWALRRISGGMPVMDVSIGWGADNACTGLSYISDPTNLVLTSFDATTNTWRNFGGSPNSGATAASGKLTWTGTNNINAFTLGTMSLSNALPVTFAHFTATQREEGIQLAFSNLTEEDVAVYHVERSANGTDFQSIGSLAPKANTNSRTDYTFLDKLPVNGANYYRIRALETTGKVVYSDVVMLRTNGKQNSFVLYPNPARIQSTLSLQMGNLPAGRYQVKVFNHLGQLLRLTQFSHSGGFVSTPLSTQGMAAGTYFIELSGGRQQVQRLVLQ